MKNNTLAALFGGYEDTDGLREKSFFCRKISGKPSKRGIKFFSPLSKLTKALAYTSLRCYGVAFLLFGLLTIFIQFAKTSLGEGGGDGYSAVIIGTGFSLLAAALLAFDKPLCSGLQEWVVTDFILFDFLRIKKTLTAKTVRTVNAPTAAIIGILLAAVGCFVPVYIVAAALGGIIYIAVSMSSTEFSLFTTLLILPLTPLFENDRLVLSVLIGLCVISFMRKVMTGKRFYRFEQYDFVILIMLFFMLLSGIFLGGRESFVNSLFSLILASGYFAASNIITNRRLFECALTAISLSTIPITVITLAQFIGSLIPPNTSFPNYNISATLTDGGTLAAFLVVGIICTYLMFNYYENRGRGVFFAILLLLNLAAVIIALRIDALLALMLTSIIISCATKNRKYVFLTIVIYILLHLAYLIPQSSLETLADFIKLDSGTVSARFSALFASFDMLVGNLFFGVGIGKEPFSAAISDICGTPYESSGNLLLQMACEGGIIVSALLVLLMLIRVRHVYRYFPYSHRSAASASLMMSGAIYSILLLGIFEDVFADPAIYCLFFVIFGIGSSMLRASKTDHDEKLGYFLDTLSLHSSSVNVDV